MVAAGRLKTALEKKKFKILRWGKLPKHRNTAPNEPGVYGLYYGPKLQYIGKSITVMDRIDNHTRNWEIPFGSFAWFRLDRRSIQAAEKYLIEKYKPPYNYQLT